MAFLNILRIFVYLHVESTSNTVIQRHKSCFSWLHSISISFLEMQKAAALNIGFLALIAGLTIFSDECMLTWNTNILGLSRFLYVVDLISH